MRTAPAPCPLQAGWWVRPERLAWALIVCGAALRIENFVHNRSLWLDEAILALDIIERSPLELVRPLDYAQIVPVGLLLLSKLVAAPFDYSERSLRLLSLVAGIGTLPLGYAVARRCLSSTASVLATGLLALSPNLIAVTGDAKHYASDIALALGLTWVALNALEQALAWRALALVALAGSVAIWFSYPAAFVLVAVGAALLAQWWRAPSRRVLIGLLAAGAILAATGFVAYVTLLRHHLKDNPFVRNEYASGFVPLSLRTFDDALWFPSTFFGLFDDAGFGLPALAGAVFLVGAWGARRGVDARGVLLLAPLLTAVVASALRIYPLYGRPVAYLIPTLILLVAEGADRIRRATVATLPMFGPVLIGLLLLHPVLFALRGLVAPPEREELRPVAEYVQAHRQQGDIVYVYYAARPALVYYAPRLGFRAENVITGVAARTDRRRYVEDLERVPRRPRVWFLFTHVYRGGGLDEEWFFLYQLDRLGARRDAFRRPGASAYLYDLADGARPGADGPSPATSAPPELEGWQRR